MLSGLRTSRLTDQSSLARPFGAEKMLEMKRQIPAALGPSPGLTFVEEAVVPVEFPFGPLGAVTPSLLHDTIQLSEAVPSGAGEKDMRGVGGREVGVCWSSLCSCSRHSASLVWPRDLAMARGRRPRESGMASARRSHLYRTSAASM
ncbi:hypothetical protein JZ751_017326 [Albula glossodonta]|uniref:Uncharacterized protein n=1 Tax=Albula glossodonta TaxID=121402 RepID=A0A8T2PKL7_9TELE|nr:hypothetical protein JZ751_017326 [Albula glossodonta]